MSDDNQAELDGRRRLDPIWRSELVAPDLHTAHMFGGWGLARFSEFVRRDGDILSTVLRAHLALELTLNVVIDSFATYGIGDLERLRFMQKYDVCVAFDAAMRSARPAWVSANRLRNDFAHRLDVTTDNRLAELLAAMPEYLRDLTGDWLDFLEGDRLADKDRLPDTHRVAVLFYALFYDLIHASGILDEELVDAGVITSDD